MKKPLLLLTLLILLFSVPALVSAKKAPATCPQVQAGTVTAQLSPEGYIIILVDYVCNWEVPPVLVASPTGQGSLWAARFEANSLTGGEGSIAVMGEPGQAVSFSWIAVAP